MTYFVRGQLAVKTFLNIGNEGQSSTDATKDVSKDVIDSGLAATDTCETGEVEVKIIPTVKAENEDLENKVDGNTQVKVHFLMKLMSSKMLLLVISYHHSNKY